jgi:hypothetical protein
MPSPQAAQTAFEGLGFDDFARTQYGLLAAKEPEPAGFAGRAGHPDGELTLESAIVGGLFYVGAVTALGASVLGGGGLAAGLIALASGGAATGLTGLLVAAGFHHHHAKAVEAHLDTGGQVVWVAPQDTKQWLLAKDILGHAKAIEILENGSPPA